jgi:hypothetical protein
MVHSFTVIAPRLLRAYRMTDYTTAGITIRIGRRSAAMDRLLRSHNQREAAFVTAFNPFSRPMPAGWNRRMQIRLVRTASRRVILPAGGTWRRWSESHALVFGPFRWTAVLARRYRQHAIVIVRLRQSPRLVYTSLGT